MKTVFIYALCEPGTRIIRDIGKAINPERRVKEHWRTSRKRKNHLGYWLSSLVELPTLLVLKGVPENEWQEWEQRYIRCARALGFNLCNATDGGDGAALGEKNVNFGKGLPGEKNGMFGMTHTPEARAKMRAANLGRARSLKSRLKQSAAMSGKNHPNFGKHLSAEIRAKIGKPRSVETRAKLRAARIGKKASSETRAKMSRVYRLRWLRSHL